MDFETPEALRISRPVAPAVAASSGQRGKLREIFFPANLQLVLNVPLSS